VDVNKVKEKFTDKLCGVYNTETYFIEDCTTNNSKYPISIQLIDYQLLIFFTENNLIDVCGELVPYYDSDKNNKKIKIKNISGDMKTLEVTINNNNINIEDDTWESFQL